ncbi:MAG: hypothetical protein KAH23_08990, partial [Kiritimatiellae bacterium]|nr:hypothetical protein [Kiritimatiellia bacterium]
MKKFRFLNILAIALLTAGMLAAAVQDVSASPGLGPYEPPNETPAPPKPPGDGDGEGDAGDAGDSSDTKKEGGVVTWIKKIVFDSSTMKDAIVTAINFIFYDGTVSLTAKSNPLYVLGSQISELVFRSTELADLRKTSWIQLRKVAFALLPLAAALTIWASMKEGLYSVTGYANTYEAVAEFFVSIALALASYWLMEQSITLVKILSTAISDSMQTNITMDVWQGMLHKNTFLLTSGAGNSIMSMILGIISFCVALAYIFSVVFAFLAREVVILLTVALAPLMIILGTIRPLSWLRALWAKAFLVFLLLLPVNVLVMGLSFELWSSIADIKTQAAATFLQLAILIGVLSVLVALNGTVGKMVFGAAVEATKKIGTAVMSAGALAGGLLVGAGGLSTAAATTGGTAASTGGSIAPTTGGGGGLGVTAGSLSGAGSVTKTSNLSSSIGNILGSSRNPIARSAGQGLRAGNAIKDHRIQKALTSPKLPYQSAPLKLDGKSMPGREEGFNDVTEMFATEKQRMSLGEKEYGVLEAKTRIGVDTAEATLVAVKNAGGSEVDYIREKGHLHAGNSSVTEAFRDYYRAEGSTFSLGDKSKFKAHDISRNFPNSQQWHHRDF